MSSYAYKTYPYRRPVELDGRSERRKVVIVGAGIAGPTLALSLAARGVPSIVLDDDDDLIDANLTVDVAALDMVGRMNGNGWYTTTRDRFQIPNMSVADWKGRRQGQP